MIIFKCEGIGANPNVYFKDEEKAWSFVGSAKNVNKYEIPEEIKVF